MSEENITENFKHKEFIAAVTTVALLNFVYFWVEFGTAWWSHSVSLFADSVDFLEDTSLNILILIGMQWSASWRAKLGMFLSAVLFIPSGFAAWTAWQKFLHPVPPDAASLGIVAFGALWVNVFCAFHLARFRAHRGSLTQAAFLSARNDALANIAIICAGIVTIFLLSGWPDLIVGIGIILMNADAAMKVFRAAQREKIVASGIDIPAP